MRVAPLPPNERSRLDCLYQYGILDSAAEDTFDDIVHLASRVCGVPISLISLIDENRQWFKARLGLDVPETARAPSFCSHAILQGDVMEVPNAKLDDRFFDNPFVTGQPDIQFYAGMPLTMSDGSRLGTLCVIDHHPRHLTDDQKSCLRILGHQVVNLLELRLKVKELDRALHVVEQQKIALNRSNSAGTKLLSIIGHDLRSPLAELDSLLQLCDLNELTPDEFQVLLDQLKVRLKSTIELSNDLLEWATEQFAGRVLTLEEIRLFPLVEEEVRDQQAALARKSNRLTNRVPEDFIAVADRQALGFIMRNLLMNANKFTENGKIRVEAELLSEHVRISVADNGVGMTAAQTSELFDWTGRVTTRGTRGEGGFGLGLRLCREFAQKQGGELGVVSQAGQGTLFYLTLPRIAPGNADAPQPPAALPNQN